MYKFDFLSSAPRNFIFQKYSNKTNFGGLLSVLYLILFLIISLYYLISYYNEDNYSILYYYIQFHFHLSNHIQLKDLPQIYFLFYIPIDLFYSFYILKNYQ